MAYEPVALPRRSVCALGPDSQPVENSRHKTECGQEVPGVAIISGCDHAEVLDPAKHALNGIAGIIKNWRETVFLFSVGFWRDVWYSAVLFDLPAESIAVIGFICV